MSKQINECVPNKVVLYRVPHSLYTLITEVSLATTYKIYKFIKNQLGGQRRFIRLLVSISQSSILNNFTLQIKSEIYFGRIKDSISDNNMDLLIDE